MTATPRLFPMLTPEQLAAGFPRTGREIRLRAPISDDQIRALKVGDVVLISGQMFTGRDAVHAYLMKHEPPVDLRGGVLYHCGPVVAKDADGGWRVTAAGPTTSIREEPYQADILERYGVRVVIGKGGMGAKTLAGLQESGGVYLNAVGGAAQFYARCINRVDGVSLLEFGTPKRCGSSTSPIFPRLSPWTRMATVCTKTSSRRRRSDWRWPAANPRPARTGGAARTPGRLPVEVDPHRPAIVRFERLEIPDRLRPLQLRKCIRRVRNRRVRRVLPGDHERHRRVRSTLVILAGRVQVARPDAEGTGDVLLRPDRLADRGNRLFGGSLRRQVREEGNVVPRAQRRDRRAHHRWPASAPVNRDE